MLRHLSEASYQLTIGKGGPRLLFLEGHDPRHRMLPVENYNSLVTGSLADPVTGLHVEIPDRDGNHVLKVTHLEDRVK